MSDYSELAQKLLTLGKLKDVVPDYKALGLPITHKIFLDNVSVLLHASQHEYTKPN